MVLNDEKNLFTEAELSNCDTLLTDSIDSNLENLEVENNDNQSENELTYDTEPFLEDEVCSTHKIYIISTPSYSLFVPHSYYILSHYSGFLIRHFPPPKLLA